MVFNDLFHDFKLHYGPFIVLGLLLVVIFCILKIAIQSVLCLLLEVGSPGAAS